SLRMLQAVIDIIDSNYTLCSFQPSDLLSEQTDGTAAENDDGVSLLNSCIVHSPVRCWQYIRQKQQLLITHFIILRYLEGAEIRKWHAQQLSLSTNIITKCRRIAQIASRFSFGVRVIALTF